MVKTVNGDSNKLVGIIANLQQCQIQVVWY